MKRSMLNQPMTYLAALALAAVGFAAQSCSSTKTTAKACSTNTDCEKGFICKDEVCAAAVTCETLKCESQGQTCITTKTESRCVTLGCRANADCTAPQVCVDSTCTVAPNTPVDSCEIMNSAFAFAPGAVVKIEVLALDASGNTIPYKAADGLTSSATAAFTADAATMQITAVAAGTSTITATVGGKSCTADFTNLGAVAAGKYRVTLLDAGTGSPITGPKVRVYFSSLSGVVDPAVADATAAANGVYTISATPSPSRKVLNVVVLDASENTPLYAPTSLVGVDHDGTRDFVLPMNKLDAATGFSGTPSFTQYDAKMTEAGRAVPTKLSLAAVLGSFPVSALLSLDLQMLAGDLGRKATRELLCNIPDVSSLAGALKIDCANPPLPTTCSTASSADAPDTIPLPRWIWGKGDPMPIGPNCDGFVARVSPGRRLNWSFGLKLDPGTVVTAALGIVDLSTSPPGLTSDFTKIAKAVTDAKLFEQLALSVDNFGKGHDLFTQGAESTWTAFAEGGANPGVVASNPTSYRPFRAKPTNFASPGVTDDPAGGAGGKMNASAVLVASAVPGFGVVPLGLGFGFDNDGNNKFEILNAEDPEMVEDTMYSRYANPPSAISDGDVFTIALTTNLKDLGAKAETAGRKSSIRIRGLVSRNSDPASHLGWAAADAKPSIGSFATAGNVKFIGLMTGSNSFGESITTGAKVTYSLSTDKLTSPPIKWDLTGATPDLVVMRVSADKWYWNVVIDPDAAPTTVVLTTHNGSAIGNLLPEAADPAKTLSFVASAVKFKTATTGDKLTALAPTNGKDFEHVMNDVESFTLFVEPSVGR